GSSGSRPPAAWGDQEPATSALGASNGRDLLRVGCGAALLGSARRPPPCLRPCVPSTGQRRASPVWLAPTRGCLVRRRSPPRPMRPTRQARRQRPPRQTIGARGSGGSRGSGGLSRLGLVAPVVL